MNHEYFMRRCIQLAKLGKGKVSPNPMVGCVIVHDGLIIGEGYHQKYGEAHAEVNAVQSVKDQTLLKESTIYVSLEPCAHFGKTPPCANLIVEKQIPRVVVGCIDSYSEVSGKGIENIQKSGAEVIVGILEKECLELNRRFFTFHNQSRPYVILKWAQTQDGFMDIDREAQQDGIFWITQTETKKLVHQWRSEEDGILVGANTIVNDNPELTVREVSGDSPTRFVIDPDNKINLEEFKIGSQPLETFKINQSSIEKILKEIKEKNISSIIIEGGQFTLKSFIDSDLWDEARILTGDKKIESGLEAPTVKGETVHSFNFGKDHVQIIRNA